MGGIELNRPGEADFSGVGCTFRCRVGPTVVIDGLHSIVRLEIA
jgi:hypothetical protein